MQVSSVFLSSQPPVYGLWSTTRPSTIVPINKSNSSFRLEHTDGESHIAGKNYIALQTHARDLETHDNQLRCSLGGYDLRLSVSMSEISVLLLHVIKDS